MRFDESGKARPTNGWGVEVSDTKFLLSLVDFLLEEFDAEIDEEDIVVLDRIREETK